jgi:hypothetical protein
MCAHVRSAEKLARSEGFAVAVRLHIASVTMRRAGVRQVGRGAFMMVRINTPRYLRKAALAALLVVLGSAASARAQLQHFNPGSLIIPM